MCILTNTVVLCLLPSLNASAVVNDPYSSSLITDYTLVDLYPATDGGATTIQRGQVSHSLVMPAFPNTTYTLRILAPDGAGVSNRNRVACTKYYPNVGQTYSNYTSAGRRDGDYLTITVNTASDTHFVIWFLWSGANYTESYINNVVLKNYPIYMYNATLNNLSFLSVGGGRVPDETDSTIVYTGDTLRFYLQSEGGFGTRHYIISRRYNSELPWEDIGECDEANPYTLLREPLSLDFLIEPNTYTVLWQYRVLLTDALDNTDEKIFYISVEEAKINTQTVFDEAFEHKWLGEAFDYFWSESTILADLMPPPVSFTSTYPDVEISIESDYGVLITSGFNSVPQKIISVLIPVVLLSFLGWWLHK